MDERFIQVEYKRFAAFKFGGLGWDDGVFLGHGLLAETSSPAQLNQLLLSEG